MPWAGIAPMCCIGAAIVCRWVASATSGVTVLRSIGRFVGRFGDLAKTLQKGSQARDVDPRFYHQSPGRTTSDEVSLFAGCPLTMRQGAAGCLQDA